MYSVSRPLPCAVARGQPRPLFCVFFICDLQRVFAGRGNASVRIRPGLYSGHRSGTNNLRPSDDAPGRGGAGGCRKVGSRSRARAHAHGTRQPASAPPAASLARPRSRLAHSRSTGDRSFLLLPPSRRACGVRNRAGPARRAPRYVSRSRRCGSSVAAVSPPARRDPYGATRTARRKNACRSRRRRSPSVTPMTSVYARYLYTEEAQPVRYSLHDVGYARYLYTEEAPGSRSRYSRSISDSMRFLMSGGLSGKRSCWKSSETSNEWVRVLRAFIVRTMAASI